MRSDDDTFRGFDVEAAAQGIEHPVKRDDRGGWFHKTQSYSRLRSVSKHRVDPSLNCLPGRPRGHGPRGSRAVSRGFAASQRRPNALSFSQGGFKRHCQSRSEPRSWPYRTKASYVVMPASIGDDGQEGKDGKGCFLPLAALGLAKVQTFWTDDRLSSQNRLVTQQRPQRLVPEIGRTP